MYANSWGGGRGLSRLSPFFLYIITVFILLDAMSVEKATKVDPSHLQPRNIDIGFLAPPLIFVPLSLSLVAEPGPPASLAAVLGPLAYSSLSAQPPSL